MYQDNEGTRPLVNIWRVAFAQVCKRNSVSSVPEGNDMAKLFSGWSECSIEGPKNLETW